MSRSRGRGERERGQSLVEMALVALVLYLLLAATVDLGRATFSVQVIEDAARVATRELALLPFAPGESTAGALSSPAFRERVFDRNWLVIDLDQDADGDGTSNGEQLDVLFGQLPAVNQQLRPLFVLEVVGGRRFLRYPGALLVSADAPTATGLAPCGLTVRIPRVRYDLGDETIFDWVDVVEPAGVATDPFPVTTQGLAALRVSYPFQAAAIGNFRETTADPFDPNLGDAVLADDGAVADTSTDAPAPGDFVAPDASLTGASPVSGRYGLGKQLALGQELRPFRRVQTAQAVFRREIFGS